MHVAQILRLDGDAFGLQVVQDELAVAFADVHLLHGRQHRAAAEHLGFQAVARGAGLEQFVDQDFHGECAVAHGRRGGRLHVAFRQHEVVHAAHARDRIVDACGDAGPEHGRDHQVFISDVVLVGKYFHCLTLERAVKVMTRCAGFKTSDHGTEISAKTAIETLEMLGVAVFVSKHVQKCRFILAYPGSECEKFSVNA
ncbi:hypothetical protein D3C72_1428490 [compost metagenome]